LRCKVIGADRMIALIYRGNMLAIHCRCRYSTRRDAGRLNED
jgi:hypothetical protein